MNSYSPSLPTGCPAFEVELPRATGAAIIRARDFGFSETNDRNQDAINAALAEAKRVGAGRLELAPGTYRCFDGTGIAIEGFEDFVFDGCGATLVFRRDHAPHDWPAVQLEGAANIEIRDCLRTAVENINMDWDWDSDPLAVWCKCVGKNESDEDNASYADFELDKPHPKYPDHVPVQLLTPMAADKSGARMDGRYGPRAYFGMSLGHAGTKSEWLSPTRLRVWPFVKPDYGHFAEGVDWRFTPTANRSFTKDIDVGGVFTISHAYYGMNGFVLTSNRHLTLRNIDIWACKGMGVETRGMQKFWQLLNVNIRSKPGEKYPCTSSADAHHVSQSLGFGKMVGCEVTMNQDDHFNCHDRTQIAWTRGPRTVEVVNNRGVAYTTFRRGTRIRLRQEDFADTGWIGEIVGIEGNRIVFDRDLPAQTGILFVLADDNFATENFLFKDCRFHDSPWSRGLFNGNNATFEGCTFGPMVGRPLFLLSCYTYNLWCEGFGCANIVVRKCRFENCLDTREELGVCTQIMTQIAFPPAYDPDPLLSPANTEFAKTVEACKASGRRLAPSADAIRDILVEGCTFVNPRGYLWSATNGRNLVFRDNRVIWDNPTCKRLPYAGRVRMEGESDVDCGRHAAPAAPRPFARHMLVGVNYWGSKAGVRMWRSDEWDEASVEQDVAALAATGVEVMRVFPTWCDFQPLVREKAYQGMPGTVLREGTDEEIFDPLWLDPGAMGRFFRLCDFAEKHGVKLMVSLVTGWMSGRLFAPRIVENMNLISDPEAIMWAGRFARAFVRRAKDRDAILAWDLGNECNCMAPVQSQAQAWTWLNAVSSAIRIEDPKRPVVSGMHSQTSNGFGPQWDNANRWNLQTQGELLDILTPHPYPASFRIEANRGPFNSFRNALHPVSQCLFYSAVSGKPAFPQEVGSLGPRMSPEWMAAKGMRQQMFACWQHGLGAYLWWCAFDQLHLGYPPFSSNAMERELGMLRADAARSPKPQALALKEFRALRDSLPFDSLPPHRTDAVCIVSEREEFFHQTFGAFMLSKAAGFDLAFAAADSRPLPDSDFYILPSGSGWGVYSQKTWETLVEKARAGATLLVTRGGDAGYSNWLEVTGLEQTTSHKARSVTFEFEGRTLSFSDAFSAEQKPVDCEVVARDSDGNTAVSVKKLGAGRVIAVNFALEKCIIEQEGEVVDGGFTNELWRIYAYAAREAGVKRLVRRDDPRVVFTEHPLPDGTALVVAVNTRDEPVECPISADGAVGRIWNGTFKDGVLSIRENDGCIFEVMPTKGPQHPRT